MVTERVEKPWSRLAVPPQICRQCHDGMLLRVLEIHADSVGGVIVYVCNANDGCQGVTFMWVTW